MVLNTKLLNRQYLNNKKQLTFCRVMYVESAYNVYAPYDWHINTNIRLGVLL